MSDPDLKAWRAQEPPAGFAERVVATLAPVERSKTRRVLAGVLLVAAAAAAIAIAAQLRRLAAKGDVVADARREVRVGRRAVAVLEKNAHVTWRGDVVEQMSGDVFWRVEPGGRFVVHTAAADVSVEGTCFRVKMSESEDHMTRRDAMVGAAGALVGGAVFVGVYEGKVAVSSAAQSVDVTAGQAARADAKGVRVTGESPDGEQAGDPAKGADRDSLLQANANLADDVRAYHRRLDRIASEKEKLEKKLAEAEAKLGDAAPEKSDFPVTPEDWKELAKDGVVHNHVPCWGGGPHNFALMPDELNKLGLAPQDGPIIQAAMQRSSARTWGTIKPLCSQALGGANVDRIGQTACVNILSDFAQQNDNASFEEAVRQVAEIEAGMRPSPGPGDNVPSIERALLALANETGNIQADLTQSLGPDSARRFVTGDQGCWNEGVSNVGPREPQ